MTESQEQLAENVELDTGGMRPDSALLREFGLPVPIDFDNLAARGMKLDSRRGTSSLISSRGREEQQAQDYRTIKDRIERSAREYRGGARGDMIADKYGNMTFREFDERGY